MLTNELWPSMATLADELAVNLDQSRKADAESLDTLGEIAEKLNNYWYQDSEVFFLDIANIRLPPKTVDETVLNLRELPFFCLQPTLCELQGQGGRGTLSARQKTLAKQKKTAYKRSRK